MLRNQNIKENYLDDTDLIYIKPEFAAKYESKKLKENDIIAMRTGYPGIACLVPRKYEGCQTFTTLIVRLKAENNPRFVCSYINSDLGKRFIESGKVGVAQQNFGAKSLAKMPIKIAPKELQDDYADFVKQVDKSKSVIQKSLDETQLLFDSLMQQYFG
jgi:type I restriction enzyme S subunit